MKKSIFILLLVCISLLLVHCGKEKTESDNNDIVNQAIAYIDLLEKKEYVQATQNYDSTMLEALPPEQLQQIWEYFKIQVGEYKRQIGIRTEKKGEYETVFVTCEFEKMNVILRIVFNSNRQIAGMFFDETKDGPNRYQIPSYVDVNSYEERGVIIHSGEISLPGTLTVPKGDGPHPAVVLVHGSGPNDRDESVGANKPFRDLACGLATQGIAVLSYDKRTLVYGAQLGGAVDKMTVKEETIDDALAAVELLRQESQINHDRIFVLGHSLGAMLIPRIGIRDNKIAGFIVMAGTARPLEDVVLEQMIYLYSLGDSTLIDKDKEIEDIKAQVAKVKDKNLSTSTPTADLPLGIPAVYWLDLRGYNPPEIADKLPQPMLILQGERDYQVTMEDFRLWEKALSNKNNVILKSYPNLNHLFMDGEGKSTPDEYMTEGHVAEKVIDDIANWLKAN